MFLKCFGNTSSSKRQYRTVIEELCHQFSLADLRKATNNFDRNRVIGTEPFCEIYKGYLQHNDGSNYTVAVKRSHRGIQAWKEFKNETELLCQLRHPNIISLVGFCNHEKEKIIVFKYMSHGSLYQHIEGGELSWKKRVEICIGAARGLHYLHAGAKRTIIHRDINPRIILLDDDMQPKLVGFDISIQGARFKSKPKPIQVNLNFLVEGSIGYLAPEHYKDGVVTDKSDVYSFGVVLLEVVWGKPYYLGVIRSTESSTRREFLEKPVEENIDPNIKGNITPECWEVFIDIILRCMKYEADERPTMGEVEVQLEHALSLQEQADITNTSGDYTLSSTTIIPPIPPHLPPVLPTGNLTTLRPYLDKLLHTHL